MKTLYVLRHGQAAPESEASTDHDRQLTRRGQAEVQRAALALAGRPSLPSLILSSSAARACRTAELCRSAYAKGAELSIVDDLYLAGPDSYLAALAARGQPHHGVAMVVGHNPGLEQLVQQLTDRSEHLATASLVEIELPIEAWSELSGGQAGPGRLVHTFRA
jgi:phosphohistidine phosphatase